MGKQKRMIYIYEENVPFYESLENKSEFINKQIARARLGNKAPTEAQEKGKENIDYIKSKLKSIGQ